MIRTTSRHPRRERLLLDISAACSARLAYLAMIEGETLRRDGIETWRELCRVHQAERAALRARDERAVRLAVRIDFSPRERRLRDEEVEADRADQSAFGLRVGEREASAWEWEDAR